MKYIAKLLGPPLRSLIRNSNTHNKVIAAIFTAVVGLALFSAISTVDRRSSGWKQTAAVVVRAGVKPLNQEGFEEKTRSLVRFNQNGRERYQTFSLDWWHREGDTVPVWTRGTEATKSYPSRLSRLTARPILWAVIGLAVSSVLVGILGGLMVAVGVYDNPWAPSATNSGAERASIITAST